MRSGTDRLDLLRPWPPAMCRVAASLTGAGCALVLALAMAAVSACTVGEAMHEADTDADTPPVATGIAEAWRPESDPEASSGAVESDDAARSVRTEPGTSEAAPAPPIRISPGLEVDLAEREVRLAAQSALDAGWLEQAICIAGTREHESLLVVDTPPRLLHAALLMLGLEPGRPGRWRLDETTGAVVREAPAGPELEILLRYTHPRRGKVEEPLSSWFLARNGRRGPTHPWRFAGSLEEVDEQGRVYLADFSGSVVGLVTFGDEVVAHEEVLADRIDVEQEPFRVAEDQVPPPGTPVSVVIRPSR